MLLHCEPSPEKKRAEKFIKKFFFVLQLQIYVMFPVVMDLQNKNQLLRFHSYSQTETHFCWNNLLIVLCWSGCLPPTFVPLRSFNRVTSQELQTEQQTNELAFQLNTKQQLINTDALLQQVAARSGVTGLPGRWVNNTLPEWCARRLL